MRITIQGPTQSETGIWDEVDANPLAVAGYLSEGVAITPLQSIHSTSASFAGADWVFVRVEGFQASIQALLDHPFTVRHAGAVCLSTGDGNSTGIIGFPLSQRVVSHTNYRAAQHGLALMYEGLKSKSVLEPVQIDGGGETTVFDGSIDQDTFGRLTLLGREEASRHKQKAGVLRSSLLLPIGVSVETAEGWAPLESLDVGTVIMCPVHLDIVGKAEVIRTAEGISGVLCPVCGRSYWSGRPRPSYDFKHFRKTIGELAANEESTPNGKRQFRLLNDQYLPKFQIEPGFTLTRSPKGTGKTKRLIDVVADCKARGLSVLLVGHRRNLLAAMAADLGLDLYYEVDLDEEEPNQATTSNDTEGDTLAAVEVDGDAEASVAKGRAVKVTPHYAICLDSVPHRLVPKVHKFDVLIIDESEQVIRHLVSKTLRNTRRAAFLTLEHYARFAKSVYLLDADLDMLTLNFVLNTAEMGTDIRFIVNEPQLPARSYELIPTKELLMAAIMEAVASGGKTYIACNSAKKATETALMLRKRHPEKRIELVTADNSQQTRVQRLLRGISAAFDADLDVLVASPSVGTGIDISFDGKCVVENVFGLFQGNIVTHFDIDQQLARVRVPGGVKVWVDPQILRYETLPEVIERELRNTVQRTDDLIGFDREGNPIVDERDKTLVTLWAQILGAHRASVNNLYSLFVELRAENGWNPLVVAGTEEDAESGKAALLVGKELREEERVKRIIEAPDIDAEEAEQLKELASAGAAMTDSESAQLTRHFLREFYVCEVDEDLIAFDREGRTQDEIRLLELFFEEIDDLKRRDRGEAAVVGEMSTTVAFDRNFRSTKVDLLGKLLSAAGVFDLRSGEFILDVQIQADCLRAFVDAFRVQRRRIESELGLVMRKDIERKPIQQLGDLLEKVGIRQKATTTKKSAGRKIRFYGIDAEGYVRLVDVIKRRLEKREIEAAERAEQKAAAKAGDNGSDIDLITTQISLSPDEQGDDCDESHDEAVTEVSLLKKLKAEKNVATAKNRLSSGNPRLDINNLPFQG